MLIEVEQTELTAEELAERCKGGCLESFEALVSRFELRLINFLNRMVTDLSDAEDLTQDTFVKAFQNIQRFDPKYRFSTWLFTIAKRTALNHIRSVKPSVELTPDSEFDLEDPSKYMADKDHAEVIWDHARCRLKPAQFEALWLRYGEGFTIDEAAMVMRTNSLRVRVLLHRGRNALAKTLKPIFRDK